MLDKIIQYSIRHKLIVILFTFAVIGFGIYSLFNIPIGAVPDITNNQVQVITTSRNLATEDVEKFLTYPVELEMANLPDVKEIRSVSKFGLSVVTVVFKDRIGTYLPRQLIAEKIKNAEEKIPAGFGKPFMGPVSTGLGEIYQYVLEVDPAYKSKYSVTDIRTIQDWIVKRQLSGIPGVVEVNTWGGYLKQYEVAINPSRLRAMNIPLEEVYIALKNNNSVAGGAYIEKENQSYFIRGEGLVESLQDIRDIVVDTRDGLPVYISDIGEVKFGHATRFGAITGNGEGEKVLGQVMMLKGANSNAVIEAVKDRVAEIQPNLPKGVSINPFLERSELIGKTTFTIAENLILGCLIVIFVVVLLLGNWRSGLVVASIIPLCLLFALSLMYIFGVDANLMSLGAIDFGIIIDGAVIIVEFVSHSITNNRKEINALSGKKRRKFIDKLTFNGASKMMHSAIFGQVIIILVFIPILSLSNVEGKMFRPMALVFCFALLGAILFCFSYVPVMSALFIKPTDPDKKTITTRLMSFLKRLYEPSITWALRYKTLVLSLAVATLAFAVFLFSRMGGEFVPTLDEGDFVIQPVLKTGTSLSKTIEATTRIEKILLDFPEVKQVVSRIGAAEVPTDPMSMEETDVIIRLEPKGEWTSAETKDELAEKFKEALSIIPGVDYEFTQPIEMRFNELITGVRADLAIKVFGEDLDLLYNKALEIQKAIEDVDGASDIIVEKIAGLPQMSVKYDRRKIAKYGLNVEDLNRLVSIGFAGATAGTVFEGEKQFDMTVRFDGPHRSDLADLETTSVQLPGGGSLPLSEFAEVSYTKGPAKISRDDTKRRVVVGVNVRNRDLESVVKDVQKIVDEQIDLPVGYSITYGGQFENLRNARERLMIAVPISLLLIFIMLHFAFSSVKKAILIYSAIPMAAVGGVLLLYLRGMPFSISAGVGFIALFGIAVLNGIVLIDEFNELKEKGIKDINERIITGTMNRLRPVLLTAAAAALGFLPMAISTSAGAEVQRPLATVVVGGLITATALTLIVLPVLYALFYKKKEPKRPKPPKTLMLFLLLFGSVFTSVAQENYLSREEAIELAVENNNRLKASAARIKMNEKLKGSAWDINKTGVYYNYDEMNIAENGEPLEVWGVRQSIDFPTVYGAKHKLQKNIAELSRDEYEVQKRLLEREVSRVYLQVVYWQDLEKNYRYLDSLFSNFAYAAERRFESGETNYLEKLTAQSKQKEVALLLTQSKRGAEKAYAELKSWMQTDIDYRITSTSLPRLEPDLAGLENHPGLQMLRQQTEVSKSSLRLEKQYLLPDLNFSVYTGTNSAPNAKQYSGFEAGVAIPLWFGARKAKIQAARVGVEIAQDEFENYKLQLESKLKSLSAALEQYREAINYYDNTGEQLASEIVNNANKAFNYGEIDFLQYIQLLENARNIQLNYLDNLLNYDFTVIELNYILN
ncbi:MAG: CusA/CzcA family heavy metal efflux RND transporter [Salinimicrobium sp.]